MQLSPPILWTIRVDHSRWIEIKTIKILHLPSPGDTIVIDGLRYGVESVDWSFDEDQEMYFPSYISLKG